MIYDRGPELEHIHRCTDTRNAQHTDVRVIHFKLQPFEVYVHNIKIYMQMLSLGNISYSFRSASSGKKKQYETFMQKIYCTPFT